jgi:hypothetical protein
MTTKYREMVAAQTLTAAASTALYVAPLLTYSAIHAVTAFNPTAAPVTVSLYKVAAGGSAGNPQLIASRVLSAGQVGSLNDAINHKLEPGTQLYALGLGTTLNVSGVEFVQDN